MGIQASLTWIFPLLARNLRLMLVPFILLLGVCEYWAFSGSFNYFWGGGDLFWLSQRFHTVREFLWSLLHTDAEGWYRPLSNRSIYSLFFPIFGLDPHGYHVVVLFLFFLNSIAALFLFRELKLKLFPACVAALFFALHSANAYTTFDASYSPELLYALFYIGSFIFFLRSLPVLSVLCFVLSLMSKEAAVTLPFTLLLYEWTYPLRPQWRRVAPYFAVLVAYLAYVAFYLRVVSGHYTLDFGKSLVKNVVRAAVWAVNLPIGSYSQYRHVGPLSATFLYVFAVCIAGISIFLLVRNKERRAIAFGAGWFLIACVPTLPIYFYFRPYYLYLPLIGVSLIAGLAVQQIKEGLASWNSAVATILVWTLLAVNVFVIGQGVQNEMRDDPAKGGTSDSAYEALVELKRLHPEIPRRSTVYIFNPDDLKSYWDYGKDAMFKVFYNDPSLRILYYSMGDRQPEQGTQEHVIVLTYRDHHLVENPPN